MRLQTWKPQKLKEKLIGNHKETQNTLKIGGLFYFTRLVLQYVIDMKTNFSFLSLASSGLPLPRWIPHPCPPGLSLRWNVQFQLHWGLRFSRSLTLY